MSQTSKELNKIAESLPYGAFKRIAENCGVTPSYVSQFFKGDYALTDENIKLLDEAEKILQEEIEKKDNRNLKLKSVYDKTKN